LNSRSEKVLKAFLTRSPQRSALERFLPEHERQFLTELPPCDETAPNPKLAEVGTLDEIHWSWLTPLIEGLSARDQKIYLNALDDHAAESIASSIGVSRTPEKLSGLAKEFLKKQLLELLVGKDGQIIPPDYLPASPLNRLALLGKKNLIRIINFLSLYDLSIEFRQIVETKILKKIYSFLSEEQRTLLQQITPSAEANPFGRLGLERWDETVESLRTLLHKRGLTRLGAALSGQEPDLVWILCHQLDIGRGGALYKLSTQETAPAVANTARHQTVELMDKLQL
jgi:hypothetical protein